MPASELNWKAMDRFLKNRGAPDCAKERLRQIVEGTYPKCPRGALNGKQTRFLVEQGLISHSSKGGVPKPTHKAMRILGRRIPQ